METKETTDITLLVVVGCLGMLVLAGFIILFVLFYQKKVLAQQNILHLAENKFQREVLEASIKAEERERERLSKNIHDEIGASLNLLNMNLNRLTKPVKDPLIIPELIGENIKLLEDSIQNIREVTKDLTPPTLRKFGYVDAIGELCKHINNTGSIRSTFNRPAGDIKLGPQTEIHLYRLTKELLNNIIKHTGASTVEISLSAGKCFFELDIAHNGTGISNEEAGELIKQDKGLGLKSLQGRAQLIDASIKYYKDKAGLSGVHVELLECPEKKLK